MICVLGGLEELDSYAIGGDTGVQRDAEAWSRSQYTPWPGTMGFKADFCAGRIACQSARGACDHGTVIVAAVHGAFRSHLDERVPKSFADSSK